jgi:antirestriction protein ArdC
MAKKTAFQVSDEIRTNITNNIINALKDGKVPWHRPWSDDPNSGAPVNVVSKKRYSGINPFILQMTAQERGYHSKFWGTYNQWAELGGQVMKRPEGVDNWGTPIVFYKVAEFEDKKNLKKDGTPETKNVFFLRTYTVFNVDQVEGDKVDKFRASVTYSGSPNIVDLDFTEAERVIKATGADIRHGGNRACYTRPFPSGSWPNHTSGDHITIPNIQQFLDPTEYYVTLFHELAHHSEVRLDWDFDANGYAMGEIVAEIAACYLAEETKVPNRNFDNHAQYVNTWLEKMQSDNKWIFKASTQASKVADYILSFSKEVLAEETDVAA